ncbi:flagellar hook protein 2 [Massilia sp. Root418]|uniref:flagellar filament capping protein FliD n=1 Tax=Massilia sp. Root418 TaxID=1736532 RepID=UPI0006FAFF20|nr:flagellar filament capping protein FliD [Massilia sp. Root418]KQW96865.1 flagellar hook protein 2 [Massilia sp. Root418]
MGISSPGIGSNGLDVNAIISKLMSVEAQPLANMDKKSASFLGKVSAFGSLSGALGSFQSALSSLTSLSSFQALSSTSSDTAIMTGSATGKALPGNYKVDISQLAQAQTLASGGFKSTTAAIGLGATTNLTIQLGTVTGGSFGVTGGTLGAGVLSGGITPGALSINGTVIATDSSIRSAKLLADAINAKSTTTGVSAKAATTTTAADLFGTGGASTFGDIDTSLGGTYALSVGGVTIASQVAGVAGGAGITAAELDTTLGGDNATTRALADANITFTGSAAAGTLQFKNEDGSNVVVAENVTGDVQGGIANSGTANAGSSVTAMSTISLVSASGSQVTVGGTNPAAAGLTAGVGGAYLGATFAQDGTRSSGNIVIDNKNNTLTGIRDAINKANFGVTASIVSDGSTDKPNHLVLTSSATGATSTMKIALTGADGNPPDADLVALLGYDPGGVQSLSQKTAAQDTKASINGIPVTSTSTTISGAVEGISFTAVKTGTASLTVAKDTATLTTSINGFIKGYNELNAQIKQLNGYNAETKTGGPLLGDSTVQNLQSALRRQMSASITGLQGKLTSLTDVGIGFQKDGTLTLDSSKLNKAIASNFNDIAGLFAAVGKSTDADISFTSSTAATKPGDYALNITTLATQGSIKSAAPVPDSVVIGADTVWTVKLNDTLPSTAANTASVKLAAGTYTPAGLATMLQSSINGATTFTNLGSAVAVKVEDDGTLSVTSNRYGSKSNITLTNDTGTSVATVFGGAASVDGVDVAGTIGGYSAVGDGQTLTGAPGAPIEGLKLLVKGDTTGERGTIGFSQGYAYQLNNLAGSYLGAKGVITGRTAGLNKSVQDIAKQKDAFNARLVDIEARYRKQYTALDTALSSMSTTASFLAQQFANMANS